VPISRLAECVTATQADIAASALVAPIVGHVGDGNFHLSLLVDLADSTEVRRAEALLGRLVERALAMDGTSTGEQASARARSNTSAASMARRRSLSCAPSKRHWTA
jgi:D-lactate dehydrogenase (cytochrome)